MLNNYKWFETGGYAVVGRTVSRILCNYSQEFGFKSILPCQ